ARAAGIPEHRLAFIGAGASASEPRDWLARDAYTVSHAQDAVLEAMLARTDTFDALELYSCFPVVPKMARRKLGLGADVEPSVTGGLSFFGGPLNVYMAHAACAMVRAIREGAANGLLYGQGEFVTKHHALILAREPQEDSVLADARAQEKADDRRGAVPFTDETPEGRAPIETFTILHDAQGQPIQGVVIARMASGARTLARIPAAHADDLALLMDQGRYPIGRSGRVNTGPDGIPEWRTA